MVGGLSTGSINSTFGPGSKNFSGPGGYNNNIMAYMATSQIGSASNPATAWNTKPGTITQGPTVTGGGGLLPGYTYGPNGIPVPTSGSTVSNYGSNTTPVSGPNGPFSALGGPLQSNANNVLNAGNTLLNTQFDPNGTLYNQQFQKQRDQTNVNEAQRGITMSPYGAGISNQADINFNSNWQNQEQQRQIAALQGAEGAINPATTLYNGNYGSSTQGYSTQPPQQNSGGGGGGGGQQQPNQSALPYPNMSTPSPYQSPIDFGGAPQPTYQAPSQQPQYDPTTGQSSSYSPLLTDTGPNWQTIMNPAMQSPYMNPSTGTPFQNPDYSGASYVDPNTQGMSDYGGASTDQLIADSSGGQGGLSTGTNYFNNVNSDSSAYDYLSSGSF